VEGAKVATNPNEAATGLGPDGEELEPGAEEQQPNPEVNDQEQPGEGEGEPPATPTVEELATSMGWKPKDQYSDPDKPWKPAHEFILFTRDLERSRYQEVRGLKEQIDVMSRTTADILKDRLEQQRQELTGRYNELVEEGNAAEAFKVSQRLTEIDQRITQPTQRGPSPTGKEWAQQHASWFNKDPAATLRAVEVTNRLAAQGKSEAEQLQAAERIIRNEFPEYFQGQNGQRREAPAVHRPGARSPGNSNKAVTFADLPADNQKVARDMVDRGVIPNTEAYVKYYVQNLKGRR
jgi:hypothetical protein